MVTQIVRSVVREMEGYSPGEQPAEGQRVVKLNTNENPFAPSEKVMAAVAGISAETLRRYPNATADVFRDAAAKLHNLTRQHIIAGNGSDDILTIATRCCIGPGGKLAFPEPTYSLYTVLAQLEQAKTAAVPWERDWSLPIDGLLAAGADAIYLANPNAPSGTFVAPAAVAELAKGFRGLLLIDEAYVDFAEDHCVPLVQQFANVVVTRSLSKAYSLAGLRLGYAIAHPALIAQMMKVKDSYNCDAVAMAAGAAALEDQAYARSTWENVKSERARVSAELAQMGWAVLPSQANFILATVPGGRAKEMYLGLKNQGILVRYFDLPGLHDKLRITIGQSNENNALLAGVKMLAAAGKAA
jgi:histidinol-phosphate aminotransferase